MPPRHKSTAAQGGHLTNDGETESKLKPWLEVVSGGGGDSSQTHGTAARRSHRVSRNEDDPGEALGDVTTTSAGRRGTTKPKMRGERPGMGTGYTGFDGPGSPDSNDDTAASDKEVLRLQSADNAEGVQDALQGLARMERRLRRETNRQRIKVEESVGTVVSVQLLADQERRSRSSSRNQTSRRGKQGQLSIKTQAAAAAADAAADTSHISLKPGPDHDRVEIKKDEADTGCMWKENGSREHSDKKPAPAPTPAEKGASRAPPVDSDYLPLPWKGRLGYACLNTYLRTSKPPVFSSRTCRMASIIDHRYPLSDPTQPEHPNRNRPDKSQKPDKARGTRFVQDLGLANARDIAKMLRWNERYGIRFLRLSSEMFPFASHPEHGYKLAPFASEVLAEAGKVAAEFGHRLTTHPGQFTQLGSPRPEVIDAAVRDLEYHDELLTLLNLPDQQDRDAVMILHMGGVYGDKPAALDRFRHNYKTKLSDSIKRRLVLENDDVSWSVHELLPVCEELNIPLVLDFHHHNIIFDPTQCREGTADLVPLIPRIRATWERKGITMKMHYSEACAGTVTPRDRRKHSPRVASLPPCPPDADLMIEAKDKEQAVFELMRNFRLPGHGRIGSVIPHQRTDEPDPASTRSDAAAKKKKTAAAGGKRKKGEPEGSGDTIKKEEEADDDAQAAEAPPKIPDEEIGMGGPEGRVYWPPGMEDWLRPLKKDQKRTFDSVEGYEDDEALDDAS